MRYKPIIFLVVLLAAIVFISDCIQDQTDKPAANTPTKTSEIGAKFSCENDNSKVQSRGYVLLMGLADHTKEGWISEKSLMEQDPKSKFVLIYDQDENSNLGKISQKFLVDLHVVLKESPVDELVIFGASAGGVTSSYSIAKLNFSGPVALHTLSSPLKGYDFRGIAEAFLGERSTYEREIALGLEPFATPSKNVKVYHHKTVTDTVLKDHYCGGFASLCDPIKIQNNNIQGSKEFYYPEYDHNPLMGVVIREVLKCYNPGISEALEKEKTVLERREALGSLCTGEENCEKFCQNNKGICTDYCNKNQENLLCQKPFAYDCISRSDIQLCQRGSDETNKQPVLKNLGVNIDSWNRQTNLAGDLLFTKNLLFDDGHISNDKVFLDFGSKDKYRPNDIGSIEYWFYVPLGTKLQAPSDGFVQVVFFNHTQDWGINIKSKNSNNWIVSFEHVVNLKVKDGDFVKAGDIVAEASPRTTFNNEIAMTELAVWVGGSQGVVKYCPFQFLDESMKQTYGNKINQLAKDWEEFIEKDVYQQEKWSLPGCLVDKIVEAQTSNTPIQSNTPSPSPTPTQTTTVRIAENQAWVPDVFTQPVPPGASATRLVLPAPIEKISLKKVGAFGAHQGGHPEGLDHEWIEIKDDVPIGSWGDGEVTKVYENRPGESRIVINFGDGLVGEYMEIKTSLVKAGDKVTAGQPIGYGIPAYNNPGYQSGEFVLGDNNRRDGIKSWVVQYGSSISPFDYLRDDVKQQLISEFTKQVIDPYIGKGQSVETVNPWEPYLTNPLLIHKQNKGTIAGEWYLKSKKWAKDDSPDIIILLKANTKYYNQNRVIANDHEEERFVGTWEADYSSKTFIFNSNVYGLLYGIFELDESGPRATLKIEYQIGSYPQGFSDKALTYIERDAVQRREDVTALGVWSPT
ncbi:MAG TPA: M23 family metallopeptidase [archaeon]|nr:M23 family metallopeptidase [archaeon]